MSRLHRTLIIAVALSIFAALPAFAADPAVKKTALTTADGNTVVVLSVSARGTAVYGMTVSGTSITDIVAPDGWAAVTDGEMITFRTVDKPIKSGSSLTFRIVASGGDGLSATFRDNKSVFASVSNI
jgi:hypothetical protein